MGTTGHDPSGLYVIDFCSDILKNLFNDRTGRKVSFEMRKNRVISGD
jgi:hypothetical protein